MQTGDNQNTCTLLLSHFVICMQYNTVRENEGQKKKVISMMRGVVVDLNQILWGIFVIVARLQLKQVSRTTTRRRSRQREKKSLFQQDEISFSNYHYNCWKKNFT